MDWVTCRKEVLTSNSKIRPALFLDEAALGDVVGEVDLHPRLLPNRISSSNSNSNRHREGEGEEGSEEDVEGKRIHRLYSRDRVRS